MRDAVLDLILGSCCVVCEAPGRLLCGPCERALPGRARACPPTPCPPGLATPMAVGEYAGALKLLVNAHKERHHLALARPLGDLLALAVAEHLPRGGRRGGAGPDVILVPVPSRARVVRARGHDPLARMARRAAGRLRSRGVSAALVPLLVGTGGVVDQAGLAAGERRANLDHTMRCREALCRRLGRWPCAGVLVLVDDVVTTGATLREAQRALEVAGVEVHGTAAVAATRRTRPTGPDGRRETVASLPFSSPGD